MKNHIVIVGGGASGFFAALKAKAELIKLGKNDPVTILEANPKVLRKVKISGGGRCNVTHNEFDIKKLCLNYPRGQKELISPFHQFQPEDTINWFKQRGVTIVSEEDGRMFPDTNSSQTIIDCFLHEAEKLGVEVKTSSPVENISRNPDGSFNLTVKGQRAPLVASKLMLATGSSLSGYKLAQSLDLKLTEIAPSLFSFKINHPLLSELSGLSFPNSHLSLKLKDKKTFKQTGPVLITHWGLSGPAVLKLSAWAAREFMHTNYQGTLEVNWLGSKNPHEVFDKIWSFTKTKKSSSIKNSYPQEVPKRFWHNLLNYCQIDSDKKYSDLSKKETQLIVDTLIRCSLEILGKNRFKEEFVECGGISLKDVNFKTMESKLIPNLYFGGELLDIDGITGGFNFQNAWTTGWIAGSNMAKK